MSSVELSLNLDELSTSIQESVEKSFQRGDLVFHPVKAEMFIDYESKVFQLRSEERNQLEQ
jgi:hypothetical protein